MTSLSICISTFLACLAGSFLPVGNTTDLAVLAAAAISPPTLLFPLIVIASTAEMASKSVLYLAGAGVLQLPDGRTASRLRAVVARIRPDQRTGSILLLASACTGFPPFYFMTAASGAMNVGFQRFLMIGLFGRMARYGVLALLPHLTRHFL